MAMCRGNAGIGRLFSGANRPLGLQLCLQAQEALEQVALAGPTDSFNIELKFAARFVKGNEGTRFDFLAIFQAPAKQLRTAAPHDAADLGATIFQGEVNMTR